MRLVGVSVARVFLTLLYSECERIVYLIELTIPFEGVIEDAFNTQDQWRSVLEAL